MLYSSKILITSDFIGIHTKFPTFFFNHWSLRLRIFTFVFILLLWVKWDVHGQNPTVRSKDLGNNVYTYYLHAIFWDWFFHDWKNQSFQILAICPRSIKIHQVARSFSLLYRHFVPRLTCKRNHYDLPWVWIINVRFLLNPHKNYPRKTGKSVELFFWKIRNPQNVVYHWKILVL